MESNAMIIKNDTDKALSVTLKYGFSHTDLYNSIITQLEWARARHRIDPQRILEALAGKRTLQEHLSGPAVLG